MDDFTKDELVRYSRQIQLKGFGLAAQIQLKNSKILCVGAGGLGTPILMYLAASGVGTIGIIDNDTVALSNLQRQVIYNEKDIGKKKAKAAAANLKLINSSINILEFDEILSEANALNIIKQFDFIIDCTDNFAARYLINDACIELEKPFISGSIQDYEGQILLVIPNKTPCYRCLYLEPPPIELAPSCDDNGVLSVLPGVIGLLQATETIKYLSRIIQSPTEGKLLTYNALNLKINHFVFSFNPLCPCCSQNKKFNEILRTYSSCTEDTFLTEEEISILVKNKETLLIDVRSIEEHEIYNIGGLNIPIVELQEKCKELSKDSRIIVYCQKGIRSQTAYELLKKNGFSYVKILKGGLNSKRDF